jgi:hypothetical protein
MKLKFTLVGFIGGVGYGVVINIARAMPPSPGFGADDLIFAMAGFLVAVVTALALEKGAS